MNADKQEQTNEAIQGHSCFSSLPAYPRSSAFIRGHSCFSFSPESQLSLPLLPIRVPTFSSCLSAFIRVHPWPFLLLLLIRVPTFSPFASHPSSNFLFLLIRVHPRSSVAISASLPVIRGHSCFSFSSDQH